MLEVKRHETARFFLFFMGFAAGLAGPAFGAEGSAASEDSPWGALTAPGASAGSAFPSLAPPLPRLTQPRTPQGERAKVSGDEQPVGGQVVKMVPVEPAPPSSLEKSISADEILVAGTVADSNPAKGLQQFGYNFFRTTAFFPQFDLPVGADYLVGPGDSLIVTVWGSVDGAFDLTVGRTGEVVVPKVGPVRVAGVPFGKIAGLLKSRLEQAYRGFDLSVTMGKIRTIKVYVLGEVAAPGDYTVSSLATVLNALSAAGGPSKSGSLRTITVRHASGGQDVVDLYDFFTRGDKSRDIRLESGDTLFVPVIGRVAAIAGEVKRPAIYELKTESTLKDLLALAEGVTPTGYLQRVQISRVVANDKKKVLDLNLDPVQTATPLDELTAAVAVQDLDVVRVFPINTLLRSHFRLTGRVERPGSYALKPGQKLSTILTRDRLLPDYSPTVLEVTRLDATDRQPRKLVVDLSKVLAGDPAHDLVIQEFDVVRVFARSELEQEQTVRISGEVQKPSTFPLLHGMTVRDLVLQAGSLTASAFREGAELSRLSRTAGDVKRVALTVNLEEALADNPKHNLTLEAFDELTVRKLPNWANEKDRYVTLSGEFLFPGTYPIYRGERLSAVIERAGGLTGKAYLPAAKFTRDSVRQLQQQRMDEALERAQLDVVAKQTALVSKSASAEELDATKATLEGLQRTIELLKGKKAEGRLVLALQSLESLKGSPADIEVLGGDVLAVPPNPASVNVLGSVYNPTTALFEPGRTVRSYLDQAGGVTNDGNVSEMYLVKADGTVHSMQQTTTFFPFYDKFLAAKVESGDTVIVPQKVEKIAWMREIKDLTQIVSQIALTAGVLIAAGL